MKEEIKDKLTDLYKVLAILLGIACFIGMFFIPDNIALFVVLGVVAGMHLWMICKIIACYKNMTQSQRKNVLYYILFTVLSIILILLAYNGWFNSWVKDENANNILNSMGYCGLGSSWAIGFNACKKDEE